MKSLYPYNTNLKDGLAGVMRVHNEESLIEACIDSCINSLDELIVVCNDCTDGTLNILKRKVKQYSSDKLKVYEYNHNVLSFGLSEEDYELAKNLPDDSPRLYCQQCNYGLAQSHYKYVLKIDTDQNYFADEILKWRNICAGKTVVNRSFKLVIGCMFMLLFSFYRRISARLQRPYLRMLPKFIINVCHNSYQQLAAYWLVRGKASVSLSGLNVFKDQEWYVPFDYINSHPPYNGSGDTVIFKLSDSTYFSRFPNPKYHSVTEYFENPYKVMYTGPVWFHQHANRAQYWDKIKKVKDEHPDLFVPVQQFLNMSYEEVLNKMDEKSFSLFTRILFVYLHSVGKQTISNNLYVLDKSGI